MLPLGLSSSGLRALHVALKESHQIRVRVSSQTLAGVADADLTPYLLDGQVNVDSSADVTRSATLTLLDERRALPFDTDSPANTALFLDRMIHVVYDVRVGDEWVPVPVFTGPVTKLDRDGDVVTVEAQGKELLAMGAMWRPLTLRKGTLKTDAIRTILGARAGEVRFSIPDLSPRLPRVLSLDRKAVPWDAARTIARSVNRQLFYDGDGRCRLRTYPGTTLYKFDGSTMTSPLQISYSADTINLVWVKGGTPKGSKTPVTYTAVAPARHPLSPQRLGRNGVPRYLLSEIDNDSIRSLAEAKAVGNRQLNDGLLQSVEASFDAVPIPHLEPGDIIGANTDEGAVTFRLQKYSLPLVVGQPMSVGYMKRLSLSRTRRHRR